MRKTALTLVIFVLMLVLVAPPLASAAYRKSMGVVHYVDPQGIDLALGNEIRRVDFPTPLASAAELREALVDLVKAGRAQA